MQCKYYAECKPEEQRKRKPYGTEWVYCKRMGTEQHCSTLRDCLKVTTYPNKKPDISEIVKLYESNMSVTQISKQLGVSITYITSKLREVGIYKPKINVSELLCEHKDEILYLRIYKRFKYEDIKQYLRLKYNIVTSKPYISDKVKEWQAERGM